MLQYVQYNQRKTATTIVAIPALGERKEIFEVLASTLSDYHLIAIDLPGHNNHLIKDDISIEKFVLDVCNLLNELSVTQAHFIGNSIGAWIIQNIYTNYPQYILSLTLLDGGYYFAGDFSESENETIVLPVIEKYEDLSEAVKQQVDKMNSLSSSTSTVFENYLLKNFVFQGGNYIHHSNQDALNVLSNSMHEVDYRLDQTSDIPILLLLADQNIHSTEQKKAMEFLASRRNAEMHVIADGYHLLPITNSLSVAQHLIKFVSS